MKRILVGIFIAGILGLGVYGYLEGYYYRDDPLWISPLPLEVGFQIRRDSLGRGEFGARRSGGRRHKGVDLLAPSETPVFATRSGWVKIGNVPKGMGNYVAIMHRDGYQSIYGHLSEVRVKDRRRIRQGTVVGAVGKTGNADSDRIKPHLHFEVRHEGRPVNPLLLLTEAFSNSPRADRMPR